MIIFIWYEFIVHMPIYSNRNFIRLLSIVIPEVLNSCVKIFLDTDKNLYSHAA